VALATKSKDGDADRSTALTSAIAVPSQRKRAVALNFMTNTKKGAEEREDRKL
jgi:hypothetical protein